MKTRFKQIAVILLIAAFPTLIYFAASTKSQTKIHGTVIDFGARTNDTGIQSFLIVKLENNVTVKVKYQLATGTNIGKKVLLNQRTTKLFDMKSYTIVKWYK